MRCVVLVHGACFALPGKSAVAQLLSGDFPSAKIAPYYLSAHLCSPPQNPLIQIPHPNSLTQLSHPKYHSSKFLRVPRT